MMEFVKGLLYFEVIMLHRSGDFSERELAQVAKSYIPLFLRKAEDEICFVPYYDDDDRKEKSVKFVKVLSQWVYTENSQFS